MADNQALSGFGVVTFDEKVLLLCKKLTAKTKTFHSTVSTDGIHFYFYDDTGIIIREDSGFENLHELSNFAVSRVGDQYVLVYSRRHKGVDQIVSATSTDAIHWYSNGPSSGLSEGGVIVEHYEHDGQAVMYGGTSRIYGAYSDDLYKWERHSETLYRSKLERLQMGCARVIGEKIHLFYFAQNKRGRGSHHIRLLRFDAANPYRRIDAVPIPVWNQHGDLKDKKIAPIGLVMRENTLISYWHDEQKNILAVSHVFGESPEEDIHTRTSFAIQKHHKNPILEPISDHIWESQAAFNAAAVYENNKVHLIYRAVGDAGVSMLGYASSSDGISIDERSKHPIYVPRQPFEGSPAQNSSPYPNQYMSGPSWGGCEDPRLAKIGNKFYLTYVAFNGWGPPRLAMSSIKQEDFYAQNWNWENPVLISRPDEVNKSGAILPEPVNGKYFVFHRVYPDILIDVVDSLDELDGTRFLKDEYHIRPRKNYWDSRKLGVGATPIKTPHGWLVIYHGVDDHDDSRYKIGAMLLDLKDPTKVLARSPQPIIEPTEQYENGLLKYGVVYPCGSVIKDDELIVYYGGSDAVLCAATAPVDEFLEKLLNQEKPLLSDQTVQPVSYSVY